MARSMNDLPDYLRARGFVVDGVPGWRTRKRPAYTGGYDPRGIVAHHTGSAANTLAYAAKTLANGFLRLPGPLCQLSTTRNGVVIFVAAGRANHAGKVRTIGFLKAGDGNSQAMGIEAMNTGSEGWKHPVEGWGTYYNFYVALCAAICDYMGWPRGNVLGHGEVSLSGKWDPGIRDADTGRNRMLNMRAFRDAVKAVRFEADKPTPTPTPQPSPTPKPVPVDKRIGKWQLINHGAASVALSKPGAYAKWLLRRKRVVIITRDKKPDVLGGLECGGGSAWHYISTKYREFGYLLVVNAGGRALWRNKNTTGPSIDKGIFKPSRWDGDTKEVPWFVGRVNGANMLTALAHLDSDATAAHNVKVAGQILDFLETKAAEHKIGRSQIVLMIDMAKGASEVRKYITSRGYGSVFTEADKAVNAELASMTYYREAVNGPSVDDIYVWVGDGTTTTGPEAARPVSVASKTEPTKPTDLDHLVLAAVLERQ